MVTEPAPASPSLLDELRSPAQRIRDNREARETFPDNQASPGGARAASAQSKATSGSAATQNESNFGAGEGEEVELVAASEGLPALRGVFTGTMGGVNRGILICVSGAKGGLTGPCRDTSKQGFYHRMAMQLPLEGVSVLQMDYRLKGPR